MNLVTVEEISEKTGIELHDGETLREYVHRVGQHADVPEDICRRVSEAIEEARFGREPSLSDTDTDAVDEFRERIEQAEFSSVQDDSRRFSRWASEEVSRDPSEDGTTVDTNKKSTKPRSDEHDGSHANLRRSYEANKIDERTSSRTTYRTSREGPLKQYLDILDFDSRRQVRSIFLVLIVLTVAPIGVAAATYQPPDDTGGELAAVNEVDQNVTFVSVQGGETGLGAGLYAIDTDSKDVIWSHTSYYRKYFDVDPLSEDQILFIAQLNSSRDSFHAIRMNWRTGEILTSFQIPHDTHDVDYIGNGTYVIADKTHDPENGHRIYEYRPETDSVIWEYSFPEHFPPTAGYGIDDDYTHLNDVDPVDNGTAYLVSPRNFDRVLLINRSNKQVVWELGEQDNENILDEQHNPVLLQSDPPVVLVADSHNNRVVEYKKTDNGWEQTWEYANWPWTGWARDADRLPNGNTLIVGSGRSRLLEVTPEKEIVWKMDISGWAQGPYDIERLRYGDEPAGPPIEEVQTESAQTQSQGPTILDEYYRLVRWVLPPWVSLPLFVDLHVLVIGLIGWVGTELRWLRDRD
jgi:hypothetical protein